MLFWHLILVRAASHPGVHCLLAHHHMRRQREAEAAEERSIQEYMRKRREREAAEATRQANKREAQDRCANVKAMVVSRRGGCSGRLQSCLRI